LPHSPVATQLNRKLLRGTLWALAKKLQMEPFQVWTFLPNVVDYLDDIEASLVVYYCVDEWSLFSNVEREEMRDADRRLCGRADVVFATAQALVDERRSLCRATYLSRHGVDHEAFSRALDR